MMLLFRLAGVLVSAMGDFRRLGPLATPTQETVTYGRVWLNDIDINRHLNNGRYLALMDLGRIDLITRCGLLPAIRKRRWMPVLAASTVRYRRSLKTFERYRMRSRLICWDDKWLYIEHQMETMSGELCAVAVVKAVFRRKGGTVPTGELLEAMGHDPAYPSPPMPGYVAAWVTADDELRQQQRAA